MLVTGASGFLGSHLARRLVGLGAHVVAWTSSNERLWRIEDLAGRLQHFLVDIRDLAQVRMVCRETQAEVVFHLAAYGVHAEQQDALTAIDVNVRGMAHLLEGLRGTTCRRVIATGTWAEYGAQERAIRESDPLEPIGVYACSKAAATMLALGLAAQRELPLVVLRPFSVYGPGEGGQKFVPSVIRACLRGESPKLTSCRQVRDYVFIDDVVDAYLQAAEMLPSPHGSGTSSPTDTDKTPVPGSAAVEQPLVLNIGSGAPLVLRDFVAMIIRHFPGIEPAFGAIPDREREIWRVVADVSQARERLGWQPRHSLEDGVRVTVDWFRSHPDGHR